MAKYLLCCALVAAALACGSPADAQYIFLDVDGDGLNSVNGGTPGPGNDALTPSVTSVDVYIVTNQNRDGSAAVCDEGPDPFSIISYEFSLRAAGSGTVAYGAWSDNMGFTNVLTPCPGYCVGGTGNSEMWLSIGGATQAPPGKYKIGSLAVTVTGTPNLTIMPVVPDVDAVSQTAFGSACLGINFDNTLRYGHNPTYHDFDNADGTEGSTPSKETTWGKIKEMYR
jgi:hypothetical protein